MRVGKFYHFIARVTKWRDGQNKSEGKEIVRFVCVRFMHCWGKSKITATPTPIQVEAIGVKPPIWLILPSYKLLGSVRDNPK